jgi:hypothetical protein
MTDKAHMIRVEDEHVINDARFLARIFETQQVKHQDRRHLPGFLIKTRWSIGEATGAAVAAVVDFFGVYPETLGHRMALYPMVAALIRSHRRRLNLAARLRGLRTSSSARTIRPRQLVQGRRVAARQPQSVRHSKMRGAALRVVAA